MNESVSTEEFDASPLELQELGGPAIDSTTGDPAPNSSQSLIRC